MPLPSHVRVRVVIQETATGKDHGFVLFYRQNNGDALDAANVQTAANDFKTAYATAIPAVITSSHTLHRVELVQTSGVNQIDAVSNSAAVAGSVSGDVMPEEVAVLIQRRTGLVGRNKRGRVFIPCVPDSFVTGSGLTSGALTAYTAVATMIKSGVNTNSAVNSFEAVQPDYKTNQLETITQCRAYSEVVSRRDRRFIKRGSVVAG